MEEPAKPTAVHYALVVFVLISIINGLYWFLAYNGRDGIIDSQRQVSDLRRQVSELRLQLDAARDKEATAKQADVGASNDKGKE